MIPTPQRETIKRWIVPIVLVCGCSAFLGQGIVTTTFLSDDNGLVDWGRHMVESDFWFPFTTGSMAPEGSGPTYYRPLTLLSHGLDHQLYGWNPIGHHVTSLVLHALCCLCVFSMVRALFPRAPSHLAIITTALFALHPAHEGAIWWIAGRMELLCALFYLLSIRAIVWHVQQPNPIRLAIATACAAAALASKEMAYSIPIVWFAVAFTYTPAPTLFGRARATLVRVLPAFIVAVVFLIIRFVLFDASATTFAFDVTPSSLLTTGRNAARHLVFPFHVSLRALAHAHPLVTGIIGLAITATLAAQAKRAASWIVFAGIAWCAITMLPLVRTMSPWTLYLPSAGVCLVLAWWLYPRKNISGIAAAGLLAIVLGAYTVQFQARKDAWSHADTIARQVIEDIRTVHRERPDKPIVILALPGLVNDAPVYMHYFQDRIQRELGDNALKPIVTSTLILPGANESHEVRVTRVDDQTWDLIPSAAQTRFAFPEVPALQYREGVVNPGDRLDMPWGTLEVLSPNVSGNSTHVRLRLKEEVLTVNPTMLTYNDGRLMPIERAASR